MGSDHRPHIFVSDLRLEARVGVNPGEQGADQPIALEIQIGLDDLALAARSERLRDTVDYVGVVRAARRVVAARHYPLVETLATCIAEAVLERPGASWVRVRLRKLECLRHASGAGIELELRRDPSWPVAPTAPDDEEPLVIVGGGVAGMAAALWCHSLGHPALLVDPAAQLGGQLHMVHGLMQDLPAMEPMDGAALAARMRRQFLGHGGRWVRARLTAVEAALPACRLTLEQPAMVVRAQAVILTMGVRRRTLGVPGERRLQGKGILATGARGGEGLAGRPVVVVGGGDSGCENALILSNVGAHVTLVHRGDALTARAQLRQQVAADARITQRMQCRVERFVGEDRLEAVELGGAAGDELLSTRAALVRVGWIPNSEHLPTLWLDPRGFVRADLDGRVPGTAGRVFVAGDLMGRLAPSVATSFGSGAVAARAAVQLIDGG